MVLLECDLTMNNPLSYVRGKLNFVVMSKRNSISANSVITYISEQYFFHLLYLIAMTPR